jgi:hypothetical protein
MPTTTAQRRYLNVTFTEWEGSRSVRIQLPGDVSVAEAIDEAKHELDLAPNATFQALSGDRQLEALETLLDAGLDADAEVDLVPAVKAG